MPLPTISTTIHELELPSTGKTIKYRPFLVREEKVLLMALETNDTKEISNSVKEVLKNCILTKGIKVESLPTFDIEFLFLNIRAKSVGEEIEVNIICPDDEETEVPVKIFVDEIKVQKDPNHTNKIQLDDKLMMEMKYPSLEQFIKNNFDISDANNVDQSFELIASCIDKIYNEEEVWDCSDVTKKEMMDFLDQMDTKMFQKIETFFETMPKLSHKIEIENPKTKVKSTVTLDGLATFFN